MFTLEFLCLTISILVVAFIGFILIHLLIKEMKLEGSKAIKLGFIGWAIILVVVVILSIVFAHVDIDIRFLTDPTIEISKELKEE